MRKLILILTFLLVAFLLPTGCGGGGGDGGDGGRGGDGAGTSTSPETALGARQGTERPGATVVAALGDSISAGSPLWDPDPAVRQRIGKALDSHSQYEYWTRLRLKRTSFRNCGVFGERTDEVAGRLEDCAKGADVLVVQGGINDIAQMRDIGIAADNLRGMVKRGQKLGLRVALVEVLPWNNGYPAADPIIRELNRMIAAIGREEDVPVFPWYGRLEDPGARGRMKREWTIDGDHPSVKGYKRLADTVKLP